MHSITLAAALAALSISALAQQAQDKPAIPCPADSGAKAKLKKGLGSIFSGTAIGGALNKPQNQDGCNAETTTAPAVSSPSPQIASAPVAPAAAPDQPKPGTSRIVTYQGRQIAITTTTDENGKPRTYVIIPKEAPAVVTLTANPDVYVSVNQPPTVYSIDKNAELTIAAPEKPADTPEFKSGTGSQLFRPGIAGDVVTAENMHLQWMFRPGYDLPFITLSMHLKSARGEPRSYPCGYAGHDAQGVDYINCSIAKYRVVKQGTRVSATETELPAQLDKNLGGQQ